MRSMNMRMPQYRLKEMAYPVVASKKRRDADPSSGVLAKFMGWTDEFRGKFGIRANADIPRDAKAARRFGPTGF